MLPIGVECLEPQVAVVEIAGGQHQADRPIGEDGHPRHVAIAEVSGSVSTGHGEVHTSLPSASSFEIQRPAPRESPPATMVVPSGAAAVFRRYELGVMIG